LAKLFVCFAVGHWRGGFTLAASGLVARKVLFSGDVQGVGFRFTAIHAADPYDVTGYVKNLPDGRVELVAEGPAAEVDGFIEAVRSRMSHYVSDTETSDLQATGAYARFGVRY